MFEDAERPFHAGYGGTEFVGDVTEEAFLIGDKVFELRGEVVERLGKGTDFIGAREGDPSLEVACGHLFSGIAHFAERACDPPHKGDPENG